MFGHLVFGLSPTGNEDVGNIKKQQQIVVVLAIQKNIHYFHASCCPFSKTDFSKLSVNVFYNQKREDPALPLLGLPATL